MGRGRVAPPIKDGDWTSVRQAINRLSALILGSESTPTFAGITLTGFTGILKAPGGVVTSDAVHGDLADSVWATTADHDVRYFTETELGLTTTPGGASLIGVWDNAGLVTSSNVEGALAEFGHFKLDQNQTGFENNTDSTISTDSGNPPTITLTPDSTTYYWISSYSYSISSPVTIQIADTTGSRIIYIDSAGDLQEIVNPSHSQLDDAWVNKCVVAWVYWETNTNTAIVLGDERHGINMDGETHHYLHDTIGTKFRDGFGLAGYTLDSSADADVSFTMENGKFYDEDLEHVVVDGSAANQYEQQLSGASAEIPVMYKDDIDGSWVEQAASDLPYVLQGGDTYPSYNNDDGDGTWSLIELGNQKFMIMWLVATNDWQYPIKMVCGSETYNTEALALVGSSTEMINWGTLPAVEFVILYQFIIKASTGGTKNLQITSIIDLKAVELSAGSSYSPTDHGALTGLQDDDHTQYPLLDTTRPFTGIDLNGDEDISGTLTMSGSAKDIIFSSIANSDRCIDMSLVDPATDFACLFKVSARTLGVANDAATFPDGFHKDTSGSTRLCLITDALIDTVISLGLDGGSWRTFNLKGDGMLEWGTGGKAMDVNLYRGANNQLRTDDNFVCNLIQPVSVITGGNVQISAGAGNFVNTGPAEGSGSDANWVLLGGTSYQLTRVTSSRRYKEAERTPTYDSSIVHDLLVKEYREKGTGNEGYYLGLVAEDVLLVDERLTIPRYDPNEEGLVRVEGEVDNVKYRDVNMLMLMEIQELRKDLDRLRGV